MLIMSEHNFLEKMAHHCTQNRGISDQITNKAVNSTKIFCKVVCNNKKPRKVPYRAALCCVMTMYVEENIHSFEPINYELAKELYEEAFDKTCLASHIQKQSGVFFREIFYPLFCLEQPVSQAKTKEVIDKIILHETDYCTDNLNSVDELVKNSIENLLIYLRAELPPIEEHSLKHLQELLNSTSLALNTRNIKEKIKSDGRKASKNINSLKKIDEKSKNTEI